MTKGLDSDCIVTLPISFAPLHLIRTTHDLPPAPGSSSRPLQLPFIGTFSNPSVIDTDSTPELKATPRYSASISESGSAKTIENGSAGEPFHLRRTLSFSSFSAAPSQPRAIEGTVAPRIRHAHAPSARIRLPGLHIDIVVHPFHIACWKRCLRVTPCGALQFLGRSSRRLTCESASGAMNPSVRGYRDAQASCSRPHDACAAVMSPSPQSLRVPKLAPEFCFPP